MNAARVVPIGDGVLVAEFDDRIDPVVNARAVALADALRADIMPGVLDIVPTFRSVAVYFDPLIANADPLAEWMRRADQSSGRIARRPHGRIRESARRVEIPVCYDVEFAPDLDDVAGFGGIGRAAVIDLHLSREYRVFMLGFVPGFAYLGTLEASIAAPRRATPRTEVPAGAVAVAGELTGVYPMRIPGGWNIIGRTPLRMIAVDRPEPSLLSAGDTVRFRRIDRCEFDRLAGEVRQ